MLLNILYAILIILLLTTVYVVVRTILFQRGQGSVKPFTAVPVDEAEIAQHLATAVRCPTAPLDDTGTPDPEAFRQLHQMLAETYPLVHQQLEREVVQRARDGPLDGRESDGCGLLCHRYLARASALTRCATSWKWMSTANTRPYKSRASAFLPTSSRV